MPNKPTFKQEVPQDDSYQRIINDILKDLEVIQGNRTTHTQLMQLDQIYRQRLQNLEAQDKTEN